MFYRQSLGAIKFYDDGAAALANRSKFRVQSLP
jgi:hypothetical protein